MLGNDESRKTRTNDKTLFFSRHLRTAYLLTDNFPRLGGEFRFRMQSTWLIIAQLAFFCRGLNPSFRTRRKGNCASEQSTGRLIRAPLAVARDQSDVSGVDSVPNQVQRAPDSWPSPPPAPKTPCVVSDKAEDAGDRMDAISAAIQRHRDSIVTQLRDRGLFVVDGLLGEEVCQHMRLEAELLHRKSCMVPSQSTRWDDEAQALRPYNKHHVLSMQIQGGHEQYGMAPRLVEYTVEVTQTLAPLISGAFSEAPLNASVQTNKLAVCLGGGSAYDRHVDNQGGGDRRKLTVLYYLNPTSGWKEDSLGGAFRALDVPLLGEDVESRAKDCARCEPSLDIAPIGDRLIGFWSDRLVHEVRPSQAPRGHQDYRYALTVWLCVDDPAYIEIGAEKGHFDDLLRGGQG